MPKTQRDYRLRITVSGCPNYITRQAGRISYFSASEVPQALSNLLRDRAAEVRFALEDATTGDDAAMAVRMALQAIWQNNSTQCPKTEVLTS